MRYKPWERPRLRTPTRPSESLTFKYWHDRILLEIYPKKKEAQFMENIYQIIPTFTRAASFGGIVAVDSRIAPVSR
jgi:hypothetical protein